MSMLARLGGLGILALLFLVGCVGAAILQRSIVAWIVAVPAAIFVCTRLFRSSDS